MSMVHGQGYKMLISDFAQATGLGHDTIRSYVRPSDHTGDWQQGRT